jgi:hypothetical protein
MGKPFVKERVARDCKQITTATNLRNKEKEKKQIKKIIR